MALCPDKIRDASIGMRMPETSIIETVLKRDRWIVIAGLAAVIVLSWIYILAGAGVGMSPFELTKLTAPLPKAQDGALAPMMQPALWTPGYAVFMFLMWWVMMLAMMLPSASPMILLFAVFNRKQRSQGSPFVFTGVFAAGYLIIWGAFSLLATGFQWGLERVGVLSAMMASTSGFLGGFLLIAGGVYQFTPLKHACLRHCRSPIQFLTQHWRTGSLGALRMGIEHGSYCVLCCWTLMVLLFVGGIMNLFWIVGLAVYVLLEKTIRAGHRLGSITGICLIACGGWVVIGTLF